MSKTVIVLGPTAVGKTKYAIELAREIKGEIISADSMQVYRGMDIGTAKPTLEERQEIPHHLIDIRDPDEDWTVSDFVQQAEGKRIEIGESGKIPIIVGGTGLYLWSLLEGYSFPAAEADPEIRKRLENTPISILYSLLSNVDPAAAKKINPNDQKRLVRALEVYEVTGKKISELQKSRKAEKPKSRKAEYALIGLTLHREELYARINERVDSMIEKGLIEEVKGLLANGYSKNLKSFQALGYKEVIEYLDGKCLPAGQAGSKEQMIEELKKRTRHFSRRQMTWFKRFKNVEWQTAI